MHEKSREIIRLITKYLNAELDETGSGHLERWRKESPENNALFEKLTSEQELFRNVQSSYELEQKIFEKIKARGIDLEEGAVGGGRIRTMTWRWLVAASVVTLIALVSYMALKKNSSEHPEVVTVEPAKDVAPGSFKARLTLEDGSVVSLDKADNRELAKQGNATVRNENGQLVYVAQGNAGRVVHNVLSTSVGESYATVLADGSRLWLNSGSSVKFPVAFLGKERVIEASGEVFLEVSKDAKRPFKVKVTGKGREFEVQVLGTQFNIKAYADEPAVQTTLIEGAITVTNNKGTKKLKPGQQAVISEKGSMELLTDVNIEAITAWRDETFSFERDNLAGMMREIARWYGVEVAYEGPIPEKTFTGMVSRKRNLSEVLKILEANNVKFRIEGKKVTILP
jgi:transmembrane sensor